MFTGRYLLIISLFSLGNFVDAQGNYVATVMQYGLTRDPSLSDFDHVVRSLRNYETHIQNAANDNARIIVFPEYGLTTQSLPNNLETISTVVPTPSEAVVPCTASGNIFARHLVDLSCAATRHNMYVVVNLVENATSSTNATIYYNTNVVFDQNGAVIARYRKINLFNEPMFTPGEEVVSFIAFNVTFGLLTSTDLLYKNPAMTLINDHQVTDLIYPHFWHFETPFLTGLSLQDGFSKAYGVNLLSSGYSSPTEGVGGSAIFLGNATIGAIDLSTAVTQSRSRATVNIMTKRTPESVCEENIDISPRFGGQTPGIEKFATRLENMELYTFADLELGVNEINGQVCSEDTGFCCDYYITLVTPLTSSSTIYKMAAFFGVRQLSNSTSTTGIRTCALLACQSENPLTCGMRPSSFNVEFEQITIKTNMPVNDDSSHLPSTLNSELQPLRSYAYCAGEVENGEVGITMSMQRTSNLFAFGIFGRAYDLDGREVGRGSASDLKAFIALVIPSIVALLFI